jgi:hypothetical protein
MSKTALKIEELFALSDALGMELFLHSDGEIIGGVSRAVSISEIGLKMNIEAKVLWSKIEWGKAKGKIEPKIGLMVHIIGDLFVLALNDRPADEVIIMLIDGAQITRFSMETMVQAARNTCIEHEKKALSTIAKGFADWSVAVFKRGQYDMEWAEAA